MPDKTIFMTKLIDSLIEKLHKGIVSFVYNKKDGAVRHACGTLYGVGHTIKGVGQKDCSWTLRYYDVDCKGWRSFIIDNLVSVGEVRKGTLEEHHDICLALVVKLKERMKNEEKVAFAYRKVDGSIRYAHGSLLPTSGEFDGYFTYFDTDKGEERKFRIDAFVGFGEEDEIDFTAFDDAMPEMETYGDNHYSDISEVTIKNILSKKGIDMADTENVMVIDLLPYLTKSQLKDLIIKATTRLAEL